jgi:hypothetical protein
MSKIEVRPIDRHKWHGKTGEDSFTRDKKIQALVGEDMKYQTGLTEEDIAFLTKSGFKGDLSDNYNPDEPHPYWDSKSGVVNLKNATAIYDTSKPLDLIKVAIMRGSKFVANSTKEYEAGEFPNATHVIFNEAEEVEIKASRVATRNNAIIKASQISTQRKKQIINILAGKDCTGKSDKYVEVELSKLTEDKAKEVLRMLEIPVETTEAHDFILKCLKANIFKKKGHKYWYYESMLGEDMEAVIRYVNDDENNEWRLKLEAKLNKD